MKFFVSLAMTVVNAVPFVLAYIPAMTDYGTLYELCKDGGENSYVGVLYEGGFNATYNYNECYPYQLADGKLAEMAVFCKTVSCSSNPNSDCSGGAVPPVPVTLVAGLALINEVDFVQFIGQGATCRSTGLP